MNKVFLSVLPISLLIVACAPANRIQVGQCVSQVVVGPCTGPANNAKVTVNTSGALNAAPPHVCAAPGTDIVFKIVPPPATTGTVAIVPKDAADTWLVATNFPDKKNIVVHTPSGSADSYHDYSIITTAGACLDPKIHLN